MFSYQVSCRVIAKWLKHLCTQASTPSETVDKERLAWQALASCLVTEHTTGHLNSQQHIVHTKHRQKDIKKLNTQILIMSSEYFRCNENAPCSDPHIHLQTQTQLLY